LIVLAFLPYTQLKALADSLVSDGNFKSLNLTNAVIFKIILGVLGVIFVFLAVIIASGRLIYLVKGFRRYLRDLTLFIKDIRPGRLKPIHFLLFLTILSAAILRMIHVFDLISHDEGYTYVVFSSTTLFNITTNYSLPNNHILNSLLIHFTSLLFGNQPWVLRLPSLLAGLLLIPAAYVLAKQVYDQYTALFSAILLAVLPGAILYSTTARGYSLVALFTILTLLVAIYVKEKNNSFAWSLLVLFSALGFYSVPVMLFPFGIVFTWLLFERLSNQGGTYSSKQNFLKYWLIAGLSTAALVLLLYTPVFIYSGPAKVFTNPWVSPEPWSGYISTLPAMIKNVWQEWAAGFPFAFTVVMIFGFCFGIFFHKKIARTHFPLQISAFLWLAALTLIRRPDAVTKIWAFLQALFCIWSAAGFMGLLKNIKVRNATQISIAGIVVSTALLVLLIHTGRVIPTIGEHWAQTSPEERTMLSVKGQLKPNDLVIIDAPHDAALWYYGRLCGLPDEIFNKSLPFDRLFVIVSPADGQTVQSVLYDRGPDIDLVDLDAAQHTMNYGYIDTYLIPHR
jgi:hypothetical protein